MPLPFAAIPPIATAVGRYGVPYLVREVLKVGKDKFVNTYGNEAFTSINNLSIQSSELFQKEVENYTNDIDEGKEEETTGTELSTEVKKEEPPKLPEEPPKGPDIGTELATEAVTQATKKVLEDKKPDVSKQTKDLVPEKPEFGKLTKTEKQTAKALKGDNPDFYSRAVDAIKNAKQNKFTKGKWKSIVQSNSTKEEMKYLGLDKYLQGNESITKEELLKFVEKKDIAPNITVRSIPKDEMNTMYEGYSLGGDQEHIVFQVGRIPSAKKLFLDDKNLTNKDISTITPLFKSEHFDIEYGTNTFAHARTQVGFDEGFSAKYDDLSSKVINTLNNTLIIDEIQSDWLQKGQDEGFVSDYDIVPEDKLIEYFKKNNIFYKLSKAPTEFTDKESGIDVIEFQQSGPIKPGDAPKLDTLNVGYDKNFIFNKSDKTHYATTGEDIDPVQYLADENKVPDFPVKESKKWVELVLNKMIEKAVLDGRDSIAITNGEIQANRYEAMGKEEKQGLKKFYDEIVFKQLEKISDKYNVELERIDITEGEAPKELQDIHFGNQIKRAQDDGYVLKKVNLQFLFDRTKDTDIPGHAALYSDAGVGQGADYIDDYITQLVDRPFSPATGTGSGLDRWNEIRNDEVYIWIKEKDISRDLIGWELPIVPVKDAINYAKDSLLPEIQGEDLGAYQKYVQDAKPPKGEEINPEQLIKMKLPKKLQKERLSTPIKLSKAKKQTDKLFA